MSSLRIEKMRQFDVEIQRFVKQDDWVYSPVFFLIKEMTEPLESNHANASHFVNNVEFLMQMFSRDFAWSANLPDIDFEMIFTIMSSQMQLRGTKRYCNSYSSNCSFWNFILFCPKIDEGKRQKKNQLDDKYSQIKLF